MQSIVWETQPHKGLVWAHDHTLLFSLKNIIFGVPLLKSRTPTPLIWRMYPRHYLPWHLGDTQSRGCSTHLTGSTVHCPCGTVSHVTVTTQMHTWTPGLPVSQWKSELSPPCRQAWPLQRFECLLY